MRILTSSSSGGECRNPSFGLATKARGCKVAGDALLGPGVNPLEGSPNVKLRKLGPKGTLPASNSKRG